MIIGLHGKIGSGKQTAAINLAAEFRNIGYIPYYRIWAGKLKKVVETLTEIEMATEFDNPFEDGITDYTQDQKNIMIPEYNMTLGRMLQVIGTDLFRDNFSKRTWINALLGSYYRMLEKKPNIVWIIADTRFPNEADEILDECHGYVFTVKRSNNDVRDKTTRDKNHESETAMDEYSRFSRTIINDGTLDDLKIETRKIIDELLNKTKTK